MKNNFKMLSLLILSLLIFNLVGCSNKNNGGPNDNTKNPSNAENSTSNKNAPTNQTQRLTNISAYSCAKYTFYEQIRILYAIFVHFQATKKQVTRRLPA